MIIDDYIKFRRKYEDKMLEHFGSVTLDDKAIIKLFLAQKGRKKR